MTRRAWLLILLAAVGCGGMGGGGFQLPGQKYKAAALKAEQVVEVDNDTEAWALTIEAAPDGMELVVKLSADQPFDYTFAPKMGPGEAYEAHTKPNAKTAGAVSTEKGRKEYTVQASVGPNIPVTLLVVRGTGSGPTKITVKREK